jgi:hypothetical protein
MSEEGPVLKGREATTKSEREVPPTPPKSGDNVLRRQPTLCDPHDIECCLQVEGVLVKFEIKERKGDLEWEVECERS